MLSWSRGVWLIVEFRRNDLIWNRCLMMLVCYAFLDVSLYACILYVQEACMVLRLLTPAYRFPRHVYLLVLYTHHIFALSQSSGNVPVSIDFWKITVKLGAIWLAHSLRIRLCIPSGPDAFDKFISWGSFSTPFSLMVSFGMGSSMCLVVCGMSFDLSMVKTD